MDATEATNDQRRTLWFVGFVCFIDMCGLGIIVPVMPSLIQDLTGASVDRAAETGSWLLFTYAVMQFLCAPLIGGLSDRFGRRPILLFTLAALGFDYILMALAPTLAWLFLGRAISGVMGATWAAANSCVADITTPETRGGAFGLLGGMGAAGFVAGPALGGFLGGFGPRLPFIAAAVLALVGTAVGYRFLRETLPAQKRRAFDLTRANPLGTIIQMSKFPLVIGFLGVICAIQLAGQTTPAVWSYYNILKFNWSPFMIGLSAAFFGILIAIVQGGMTGPAIARFGAAKAGLVSLAFAIPAYLMFAFATTGWMMFAGIAVAAASNLAFPAMQMQMSKIIPENAQGELQGAVASIISLTSIPGPVLMAGVFAHFSDGKGLHFPGAAFLLAALLMALAVALYALNIRRNGSAASS